MRKIYQTFFIYLTFFLTFCLFYINSKPIIKTNGKVEVYLGSNSSCCKFETTDYVGASLIFNKYGESVILEDENFNVEEFFRSVQGEIVLIEEIEGGTSFYAYSKEIKYLREIKGERINLHVYVKGEKVIIASPIIFGSY